MHDDISRDICSELLQCRYCRTEYKISFKHNCCAIEFIITIWKDLGKGPQAKEWKAHFPLQDQRLSPPLIRFRRGEIASLFQEGVELGRK